MPDNPAARQFEPMVHGLLVSTGQSLRIDSLAKAHVSPATLSRAKAGEWRQPSAEMIFQRVAGREFRCAATMAGREADESPSPTIELHLATEPPE
jgi:hypothetical protein